MPPKPAAAAPKPAIAAPAAIKPGLADAKKGTSKVEIAPPARPAPQATVKIGPAAPAAAPAPALKTAAPAEVAPAAAESDSLTGILAIAATVMALAALGIQVWMFL